MLGAAVAIPGAGLTSAQQPESEEAKSWKRTVEELREWESSAPEHVELLIEKLRGNNSIRKAYAAIALAKLGAKAKPATWALMETTRDDTRLKWGYQGPRTSPRKEAIAALAAIGDASVQPLICALTCGNDDLERAAAEALGLSGDSRAVEPLIAAFEGTNPSLAYCAAGALGNIGDPKAVEPLMAALKSGKGPGTEVALALGRIGDRRAVDPLISVLTQYRGKYFGACAAEALGEIGDTRAVEPLIAAMKESSTNGNNRAAEALGKIGDRRAMGPLIAALKSTTFMDKPGVRIALENITGKDFGRNYAAWIDWWESTEHQ